MLGYYYNELRRCNNLLRQIDGAVATMNGLNNSYQDIKNKVEKDYIIDGEEVMIKKRIVEYNESVTSVKDHLNGATRGKVGARIAELQRLIEAELERLRRAAEAAAAASSGGRRGAR